MSGTAFVLFAFVLLAVVPTIIGLWVSGPPGARRLLIDAARGIVALVRLAVFVGVALLAVYGLVRLVRLAWSAS